MRPLMGTSKAIGCVVVVAMSGTPLATVTCRTELRSPTICEGCALRGVAFRLPRVQRFPLECAESSCECADGSIASSQIRCGPVSKTLIYRTSASEPFCVPIMKLHGTTTERDRMGQCDHKDMGINREQARPRGYLIGAKLSALAAALLK